MSRIVLLNPGPVNITDKVRQAMTLPDLCHREKEFFNLMSAIRTKLLQAFNIEETFTSVLVSGSGTAGIIQNEAVVPRPRAARELYARRE